MADFTPVEEVQRISVVQWDMAEKEEGDFFREGWVEEVLTTEMLTEDLEEVVERDMVAEAGEGTLVGAVEVMKLTLVVEEEDLTMLEKNSRMAAVITQLAMVR